jgi:DNA helicase-2/ATP-dependent DNA helicase PcrA
MNNTINYLDTLNPAQFEAVTDAQHNLLVLAGAGSGKTKVLTHRIAWLIHQQRVSPYAILAVTFTNKAAHEMKARVEKLIEMPTSGMWIGTFHSIAHRLLRLHWQAAKLPETFQIIDSEDQYRLIRRIMKNLNLDESAWPPKQAQWYINKQKDEGIRSRSIVESLDLFQQTMLKIYQQYEKNCEQNGLVDFAELLLRAHELWLNNSELLNHYAKRFQHILVDEFQDTNAIQYAWLKLLLNEQNKIMVVGDDDQSIYGWRGAEVKNILQFDQDIKNTKTVRLEQNYRSTGNILRAANAVIAGNYNRLGKNLWTKTGNGEPISLYAAFNDRDEARFIANRIITFTQQGNQLSECAILYRSNAQSRVLEETLIQANLPYRIYGGMKFFERAEIKNALAYLRLIINRNDDPAFERIVNVPTRGIGNTTLTLVRQTAREYDLSLWQTTLHLIKNNSLNSRSQNNLSNFINLINSLDPAVKPRDDMTETHNLELHELTEHVLKFSGLLDFYKKDKSEKNLNRCENLNELISATKEFDFENDEELSPLTAFLTHAALEAGENQADTQSDCIQLMTLHAAKGLEFPVVFLTGLEEGLFPHQMSMDSPENLEEERRLCYVGITRAKQKLYLTYAHSRMLHGAEMYRQPSQFLQALPSECLDEMYMQAKISRPVNRKTFTQKSSTKKTSAMIETEHGNFKIGQIVSHQKFGDGIILNFESDSRVQINFKKVGTKTLDLNYAKLS